jgi:hypothetical protein
MNLMQRLPGIVFKRGGRPVRPLHRPFVPVVGAVPHVAAPRAPHAAASAMPRAAALALVLAVATAVSVLSAPVCLAAELSATSAGLPAGFANELPVSSLTYDGLIETVLRQSSIALAARQDYELARLKNSNSAKLWDPEVNLSGTLESYNVVNNTHSRSAVLSLKNQAPVLGGTASLEATSTFDPDSSKAKLRNRVAASFERSLTTGGIEAQLVELQESLAFLQADKTYADSLNDLVIKSVTGLSSVIKERNGLITAAIRLEQAIFAKAVADQKYSLGMISASSLATAQDSVSNASKTYFDKLTSYRNRLWEFSRNTGLSGVSDSAIDEQLEVARQVASEFLLGPTVDGEEARSAALQLLATLKSLVLLPEATVADVDLLYDLWASMTLSEDDIRSLPAMMISDLSREIQMLNLEKSERDLGWQLSTSASASWQDYTGSTPGSYAPGSSTNASVAITFRKQLLGSSMDEKAAELEIKRLRLQDEAAAALSDFTRQLNNLRKTVEDRKYAENAASESLRQSRALWDLTVANYALGIATRADVLSAAVSCLEAETALRSSAVDCIDAKLRFLNAMGESVF